MQNKCINLRFRKKQGKAYCYCTKKRAIIELSSCLGCVNKEYKKVAKMVKRTRIKPISKKRVVVSKKTYNEVYERCNGRCAICGTTQCLEYHHVRYRSERPDLIDDPNNGIMLCGEFANNCHKGVAHKNKKYWQPILLKAIEKGKIE